MNRGILLDRDGTINVEIHYLHEPEKFCFEKNVPEALKRLYQNGYFLFIITNQGAIGKGLYKLEDMERTNKYMIDQLIKVGVKIEKIYYCPHSKEENCSCRKPQPGMIFQAISEYNLDPKQSWMIGDKLTDIQAGKNAGIKTILVMTGYGKEHKDKLESYEKCTRSELMPTDFANDLWHATKIILEE